ncbi:MAG: N-6 DNA methylase [Chloroflexi bacterium]|nr:N-6 DNA methylase [Chloroflexota bacterium]
MPKKNNGTYRKLGDQPTPYASENLDTRVWRNSNSREVNRMWILNEIFERYAYPKTWLDARIFFSEKTQNQESEAASFFGFCLLTLDSNPFMYVSVGERGEVELADHALRNMMLQNRTAGLGIATDGSANGTRFLRRRFDSDKCDYIPQLESYSKLSVNSRRGRRLGLLSERVENILFEAHSHIRDIDGLHPDESLDELCKVLIAKLYDENPGGERSPFRIDRMLYGSTEEFAATIRGIYDEANAHESEVHGTIVPKPRRTHGVFSLPIRLSSPATAKVAEVLQDYNLTKSDLDIKGRAFQKVLNAATRSGMGQYFTPDEVVRFIVRILSPSSNELVLDPFCGSGRFLSSCLKYVQRRVGSTNKKIVREFSDEKLHGIEKSDRMVRIAMAGMQLQGDGHTGIRCADSLLDFSNYSDLQPESFDVIMTNPPFGSVLGPEAVARLGSFALAMDRKRLPLEVLGLERCVEFLRPGGRIGIVLPDGLLANPGSKYVREWLATKVRIRSIVSLPIETFAPFGANVKTSILFARKWRHGEQREFDYGVNLVHVDNVGYDASGRPITGTELEATAIEVSRFLNEEGW